MGREREREREGQKHGRDEKKIRNQLKPTKSIPSSLSAFEHF